MKATLIHTHTGCRPYVGHVHSGSKLWGHRLPKAGRRHALVGGPTVFTALCGESVVLERRDEFGYEVTPNVRPVTDPDALPVTCRRCLKAARPLANHWTEEKAAGDVDPRRCVHGVPLNVFCGRCES